ncbi:hypothetical protein [Thermosulfurimonas sp. F29]|uniref:hypothetical protein n=1 Tax=Thermosulfurimonas sp. F29 TaxID=2867247 RepID=UPI0021043A51|nr:hypothetical protein [Thermosulfurimonas sp. F29]
MLRSKMWPTPTWADANNRKRHVGGNLSLAGAAFLWPTPRAQDSYDRCNMKTMERIYNQGGDLTLSRKVRVEAKWGLWPTPTGRDWKDGSNTTVPTNSLLGREAVSRCHGQSRSGLKAKKERIGRLSVSFVEWLMGFPLGWTDVE